MPVVKLKRIHSSNRHDKTSDTPQELKATIHRIHGRYLMGQTGSIGCATRQWIKIQKYPRPATRIGKSPETPLRLCCCSLLTPDWRGKDGRDSCANQVMVAVHPRLHLRISPPLSRAIPPQAPGS
ncbi:hypothetical protein G7Y89_g9044 [Cudoniella acicularis]|uniref:Uncharacterized protein n=1 Tax=Cudoniella acicularis TaxID=354080 RepID=A0A8H4RHL5_9HELO|nr:hypothetical protein G7Y89_g9044 [Cudoniella acicularis]